MTTATVRSVDPWTGGLVFERPIDDPDAAVGAACDAAAEWAAAGAHHRGEVLTTLADGLSSRMAPLAELLVAEVGKRHVDAIAEVEFAIATARFYADHPPPSEPAGGATVHRRPVGVVAAITPWNVPLVTPLWKLLPALMAGNAVVWKPSERATGTAVACLDLLRAAGLAPGVVTLVSGGPAAALALCEDPRVDLVHFTGSAAAGREVAGATAGRLARCALELSGVNPAVVFADADVGLAAGAIVECATALSGQKCTATRRVLVERQLHDVVRDALAARIDALRVGDPRDADTDIGPMIGPDAVARASAAVDASLAAGARLLAQPATDGPPTAALFGPALLGDLAASDPLRSTECFAPVLTLEPFDDAEHAWALADATPFGLSASVFTQDPDRLRDAPARLRAGVVALNRRGDEVGLEVPFGGAKASGNGVPEGGLAVYAGVTTLQAVYQGSARARPAGESGLRPSG